MLCRLPWRAGVVLVGASLALASPASAQLMSTNSASYNGGYGRYNGQENGPISDYSNHDANGNMLIVDGLIQNGSSYSSSDASGSSYASGGVGVGSSSATAIGNSLNVVTQGSYNTVVVNSTQINNGNVTAGSNVGGASGQ